MARRARDPVDRESRFDIDELFFSTTDRFGKIRSGNHVFQRVAGFALEEMLGEPHSLIRHPDMPRAAFHLLWEYVNAGRPVIAYVKNMASDGSHYWVLATVVPIPGEDGFVSVRLKPTSEMLPVVQEMYRTLRETELSYERAGDRPAGLAASIDMLPQALADRGFPSYDAFMHHVLPLELRSRDAALGAGHAASQNAATTGDWNDAYQASGRIETQLRRHFATLEAFVGLSTMLDAKSRFVRTFAGKVRLVALNATARSARLGEDGAGLGVISNAIGALAEDCGRLTASVGETNTQAAAALRCSASVLALARVQLEMVRTFQRELFTGISGAASGADGVAGDGIRALVTALAATFGSLVEANDTASTQLHPLQGHVGDLQRIVQMLAVTLVMGRVEASHLVSPGEFAHYFDEVAELITRARSELHELEAAVTDIAEELNALAQVQFEVKASLDTLAGVRVGAAG